MSPLFAFRGDLSKVFSFSLILAMFSMFLRIMSFLLLALPIFFCCFVPILYIVNGYQSHMNGMTGSVDFNTECLMMMVSMKMVLTD